MASDLPQSGTNTRLPVASPSDGQCFSSSGSTPSRWKPILLSRQRCCQKSGSMRSSVGRGYAPDGSCGIEVHVGGVAPTYSTESPSTFCHPLGSSPPRLARAPMYWSRSLNDRDIVRAPDFTDSVQIGRAHVCTPVTNAHLVRRLLLEKK